MEHASARLVLIGGLQTRVPPPGDYSFLGEVWRRVRGEVSQAGPVVHYVGLRTPAFGDQRPTFLAAEVADPALVPEGMLAWVLETGCWRVMTRRGGALETLWEAEPTWLWRHHAPPQGPTRSGVLGEFVAELPPSWREGGVPDSAELSLWHQAYTDLANDGPNDEIELVDHRSRWRDDYAQMAGWLHEALADRCEYTIEHVGSTAIDRIPAKPIIDLVVETPDLGAVKAIVCPLLNSPLWECWASDDGRALSYAKRERLDGRRTHHVHLQAKGSGLEPRALFRDFLRAHPEDAARYATLKREILNNLREHVGNRRTTGADRERYMRAKSAFVQEILARARREA